MVPSIGRIVHYRLTAEDAQAINKRRADARGSEIAAANSGAVVHHGNPATEGDVYPMLITRVWAAEPTEATAVNGQVFLDGNDSLWLTSVVQGDGLRHWFDPRSTPPR